MGNNYLPGNRDFYPSETKTLSLRDCALMDARMRGITSDEFFKMRRMRKYNKRKGKKTNVGDPNPSGNSVKARGK